MSSFLSNKEIKKNGLSQIIHSNKNILLKKRNKKKKEEIIYHNDLHENIFSKKNALISNTSVKKMKQIKKISINDTDNKGLILKGKKILDSSNKENHVINDLKRTTQQKLLKNIVNAAKIQIKHNLPKNSNKNIKNKKIFKNKNKLSVLLNNSDNITKCEILKKKDEKVNNKKNNKNIKKHRERRNNSITIYHNKSTIIKNRSENDLDYSLNSKGLDLSLRYEKKNMSEKKILSKIIGSSGNIISLIKMKKQHIKYSLKKKKQKPNINIKNKNLVYEDGFLNHSYFQKYNSINNEIDNNRSYMEIINNFDIINIINKKEQRKRISSSNQIDNFNNTEELSKNRNIKKNNTIIKNSYNNINISIKTKNNNNKLNIKKETIKSYGPMTMRNINPSNNNISLLNIEKKKINNSSFIDNNNIIQNKWDKKYFIPIVSASLVNAETDLKNKENKTNFKKIRTNNNSLNKNNYTTNTKKSNNFGDNNKKKREMLFNFSNKKSSKNDYSFISFHSKRTNSFISKRNKHITERNNSINNMKNNNYNSNIEKDLFEQEKKLELILNEISQEKKKEKMDNSYKCGISVDNICDISFEKNKMGEIINQQSNKKKNNKKYKAFHIKVNSLNIIKTSKDNNNKNNELKGITMIIKRGDLLNRLRKIKHNYSAMKE